MIESYLFWFFIFIELAILARGITVLKGAHKPNKINNLDKNISIIIPLKGWDPSLPELVHKLTTQCFTKEVEIILVVDQNNPHLSKLPQASNIVIHHSLPIEPGWRDKNWRLYQGSRAAHYDTLLFLDSDVAIDIDYLSHRLNAHRGDLSFSIPLYTHATSSSGHFLASCTNFLNFSIYKFGFALFPLGTAIGPSMLFNMGRDSVCRALEAIKGEVADDHALGYWFKENGYRVECCREPVYVETSDRENWRHNLNQLIRWFSLPRTIGHLLTPASIFMLAVCSILNTMSMLWILCGLITTLFYSASIGGLIVLGGFIIAITEATFLFLNQRAYTKRTKHDYAWNHFLWLPIVLLTQWILFSIAMTKRTIKWREETIQMVHDS